MLLPTGMMDRGFTAYTLSRLLSNTLTYLLFAQHKKEVIHLQKKNLNFSEERTPSKHILLFNFII
jgi:hypothetical protein